MTKHNLSLRLAATSWLSLSVLLWSCGPRVDPPRGDTPPGAGCEDSSQCQSGLVCEGGACVYERCNSAPDPDVWCAEKIGETLATSVVCERGTGDCEEIFGGIGSACRVDGECGFGLVCEQARCEETCTSSASCRASGLSCLPRDDGEPDGVRLCKTSPDCDGLPDPKAFCAEELGLPSYDVLCNAESGACEPVLLAEWESCRFDQQCETGVCEQQLCTRTCQVDSDCVSDQEVCRPRGGELKVNVCQPRTCLDERDPDSYCEQELGQAGARCSASGECRGMAMDHGVFILIEDTSMGDACSSQIKDVYEPGSDLMYIFLYDEESGDADDPRMLDPALARVHHVEPGVADVENTLISYQHLEQSLTVEKFDEESGCVRSRGGPQPDTVYSMGCGGKMIVSFERNGTPVRLTDFSEILIGEYGPLCLGDARDDLDSFRVFVCRDTNAVANQLDDSSCDTELFKESFGVIHSAYVGL